MTDVRNARFYVIDENAGAPGEDALPQEFEAAFAEAKRRSDAGARIHVLYTDEATETEITRFVTHGIPTSLASGG